MGRVCGGEASKAGSAASDGQQRAGVARLVGVGVDGHTPVPNQNTETGGIHVVGAAANCTIGAPGIDSLTVVSGNVGYGIKVCKEAPPRGTTRTWAICLGLVASPHVYDGCTRGKANKFKLHDRFTCTQTMLNGS